jgi:hypothetical protein
VAQPSNPTLSTEQVAQALRLMRGVDGVELKFSVPDAERRSTVAALDMDPLDAQIRQVVFFDTPDLTLNSHGVVVRARRIQGKAGDAIVKLRPLVPDEVPPEVRTAPGFGVELDAMPGGFVCSGAMKAEVPNVDVREVVGGNRPLRKLLNKAQRALYEAHAPDGLSLDELAVLGPINVLKLKFTPTDFGRRVVAELWTYPDGSRILELSTKCAATEAFEVAAEARAFLTAHGIDLTVEQQTKTKTALEFFAREIGGAEPVQGQTDSSSNSSQEKPVSDLRETGAIDWLLIEAPDRKINGELVPPLLDLVDKRLIRILDAIVLVKPVEGEVQALTTSDLDPDEVGDLGALEGASSGLLSDEDVAAAGAALQPNSLGLLIVYENLWSLPFAIAARNAGGQLVGQGHIPIPAIVAALDAAERQ